VRRPTISFLGWVAVAEPYYFRHLLAAYQEVYRLAPSLADLLAPPYDATLPPLLHGNQWCPDWRRDALGPDPDTAPEDLVSFRANPRHPLRLASGERSLPTGAACPDAARSIVPATRMSSSPIASGFRFLSVAGRDERDVDRSSAFRRPRSVRPTEFSGEGVVRSLR
jgi:hypothetical protein